MPTKPYRFRKEHGATGKNDMAVFQCVEDLVNASFKKFQVSCYDTFKATFDIFIMFRITATLCFICLVVSSGCLYVLWFHQQIATP